MKLSMKLIYDNEYIENKNKVFEILNNYNFDLHQLPTTNTYNYVLTIGKPNSNVNTCFFDYREGLGHDKLTLSNKEHKILNALWCVLDDYKAYYCCKDAWDFCDLYGYEQTKANHNIYNMCGENVDKMLKLFTRSDLDFLAQNIQF